MNNIDISPDDFALLSPDEQMQIMKKLIKDLPKEELMIIKNMLENEINMQ